MNDSLVDSDLLSTFVDALNRRGFESVPGDSVPPELRTRRYGESDPWFDWKICPAKLNPWVEKLEAQGKMRFPGLFRQFISAYRFLEFELGPILFFANTGDSRTSNDLSTSVFVDKHLYPSLLEGGFLQIGRQASGDYDPTCFEMRSELRNDAAIVRIDHEEILVNNRLKVVAEIAPSFRILIESFLSNYLP